MATRVPPLKLTRDQLALFLKDHEQIRAFENLFALVEPLAPDTLQELEVLVATANAQGAEALASLPGIVQEAAIMATTADSKASAALQAVESLRAALDLVLTSPPKPAPSRVCFGSFYDTTTQTAALANTAYAMTLNTTDLSFGVQRGVTTSQIFVYQPGVYNIQFSAQLDNTSGGDHQAWIWLRVNGADVANTASEVRLKGNDAELVAAWNFFYDFKAGDYFEVMWAVANTGVQIKAVAASAPVPAIPSVILTVSNNIRSYPS